MKKKIATKTTIGALIPLSVALPLISTAVLFSAIVLSFSLPHLFSSDLPNLWSSLRSWFRPPYLFFIVNAIIITIAATYRLNHHNNPSAEDDDHLHQRHHLYATSSEFNSSVKAAAPSYDQSNHILAAVDHDAFMFHDYGPVLVKDVQVVDVTENFGGSVLIREEAGSGEENEMMKEIVDDREETTSPIMQDSVESLSEEKPSAISRFAHFRRTSRAANMEGGRALRVAKPKRQETLEATWKAITEGRPMPLTRHLKKSDTWEVDHSHNQENSADGASSTSPHLGKKSVTFNDRYCSPTPSEYSALPAVPPRRLRKEPSLSQDELNRRVEAFINKVNGEMRLQRQQSLQQFMEMINRGA